MSAILERKGRTLARVTGSHHIFIREGRTVRITVPVHGSRDLKRGLQRVIMKEAGLTEDDL